VIIPVYCLTSQTKQNYWPTKQLELPWICSNDKWQTRKMPISIHKFCMRTECRNVVGYALISNKHLWFFSLKQSRKYLSPHTLLWKGALWGSTIFRYLQYCLAQYESFAASVELILLSFNSQGKIYGLDSCLS